ncbi:type II toxin-antitoxin system HigB family toxin [Persicobacter sp. CCB-QB2]|uniref:type II toxin-antitoxin system HigB family toxin n=1 Tax=Persicobacter sp. CCB-QB2 TaxID=1561025 RepID=UPI0006A9A052|nr:type II toxin-antitoxin system HigB family toxin [Persicobacter sp. CCB-QB2]
MRRVHIISRPVLKAFVVKYPDSKSALDSWWQISSHSYWQNWSELKSVFPQADKVGDKVIFNIGRAYRLICRLKFGTNRTTLFVLWLGHHNAYDKLDIKKL